jgi:hypothetical protein
MLFSQESKERVFSSAYSNVGNPLETGAGAVSWDEKAPSAQLGEVMFGRNPVY